MYEVGNGMSNTIFVLFVNCRVVISVIFRCSGQILGLALVVQKVVPLSTIHITSITDSSYWGSFSGLMYTIIPRCYKESIHNFCETTICIKHVYIYIWMWMWIDVFIQLVMWPQMRMRRCGLECEQHAEHITLLAQKPFWYWHKP